MTHGGGSSGRKSRRRSRRSKRKTRRSSRRATRRSARTVRRSTRRAVRTTRRAARRTKKVSRRTARAGRKAGRRAARATGRGGGGAAAVQTVKPTQTLAPQTQTLKPQAEKKGFLDKAKEGAGKVGEFFKKDFFTGIKDKEGQTVRQGTLSIGPGGAATMVRGAKGLLKGRGILDKFKRGKGAVNVAGVFKKGPASRFFKSKKTQGVGMAGKTTPKTTRLTGDFIKKIGGPSTVLAVIGSYPFASFIKEEALQTIGFAEETALREEDVEGYQKAKAERDKILDPGFWSRLIDAVPFANIISNLKKFFEAARLKGEVNDKKFERLLGGEPTPQEEAKATQQQEMQDFWTQFQEDKQSAIEQNQEFWGNYLEQKIAAGEELEDEDAMWLRNWNAGRSQLGFGLL